MKKSRYSLLLSLLLLLSFIDTAAQTLRSAYPVQANIHLVPPYSLYLSDYCNSSREKLRLVLLNRDLQQPELLVKLHLSIKAGNGLLMETRDYADLPVFTLSAGIPYQISQSELCPYLNASNLIIQGAMSGGRMPEGMVEVCVTVKEAYTGREASPGTCAMAWVTLNRPPLLNVPVRNLSVPFREPVSLMFQWTPRHQGLSGVEYEFTLKEVRDRQAPVEASFGYSPLIYSETRHATSLAYTAMHPPLQEGMRYAWQVRAVVRDGFEELNVFENQGYSEIYTFDVSESCKPPAGVSGREDQGRLRVEWNPLERNHNYLISFRAKGLGGDWITTTTNRTYSNIHDLRPGVAYEYRVGVRCTDGSEVYGPVFEFTLPDRREEIVAECGKLPPAAPTNSNPLPALYPGDVVLVGDFELIPTEVRGSHGHFSGSGFIRIPYLLKLKIAVTFTGITVNTDHRMTAGEVVAAYDVTESQIGGGTEIGDSVKDLIDEIKTLFDLAKEEHEKGNITEKEYGTIQEYEQTYNDLKEKKETLEEKIRDTINDINKEQDAKEKLRKEDEAKENATELASVKSGLNDLSGKLSDILTNSGIDSKVQSVEALSGFEGVISLASAPPTFFFRMPGSTDGLSLNTSTGGLGKEGSGDEELKGHIEQAQFGNYEIYFTTTGYEKFDELKNKFKSGTVSGDGCLVWLHYDAASKQMGFWIVCGDEFFGEKVPDSLKEEFKQAFIQRITDQMTSNPGANAFETFFSALLESRDFCSKMLSVMNQWIQQLTVPEQMWRQDSDFILKFDPFPAGVLDGVFNEAKGLSDLGPMIFDLCFKPDYREEFGSAFSQMDFGAAVSDFWESKKSEYGSGREDELSHQTGSDLVAVVSMFTGVKAAYGLGKGLVTTVAKTISKIPSGIMKVVSRYLDEGFEIFEEGGKYFARKGDEVIEIGKEAAQGGGVLDAVFNLQKSVITKNKDIIATASNNAKGAFGEIASDVHLTESGYQALHSRKTALTDGWGETGIDGVFIKDGQYYIVEAKYHGTAKLGMTQDGLQMSKNWIEGSNRLRNAVGQNDLVKDIIDVGYKRLLAEVEPSGSILYKLLDENAKVIGTFTP